MNKYLLFAGVFFCGFLCCAKPLELRQWNRKTFLRNEKEAFAYIKLTNPGPGKLSGITLQGEGVAAGKFSFRNIADLSAGQSVILRFPVETRLQTGHYFFDLQAQARKADQTLVKSSLRGTLRIGPVRHDSMPVILWMGKKLHSRQEKKTGFTHVLESVTNSFMSKPRNPRLTEEWITQSRINRLDALLYKGYYLVDYNYTAKTLMQKYPRYELGGRPNYKNTEASHPDVQRRCVAVTEKSAKALGSHPVWEGALINSEVRDRTLPSFGKYEPEAFRKYAGMDIPKGVSGKLGPSYKALREIPVSRIVPEKMPLFLYYKWFWKEGDGWNVVHSKIHDTYKKYIKRPFFTFFDPAVRVPPVWGSGGKVDYISHWTYAYPDPISIGANTAELHAMAKGQEGQGVMNMTQIISYRSLVAPVGKKVPDPPAWVKEFPTTPFITLVPDLMKIAVWTQISRHVSGIMFHGDDSLYTYKEALARKNRGGYQCTNPETEKVLRDFLHKVVKPLGPVLKRIPERPAEVALLESFSSSIFAYRGTWGWRGWGFDAHLMLMWANLPPEVVYEETLARDGLKHAKVLVLPFCDLLTEGAYKAIRDFQKKGGIIVGDETIVPGITPDLYVPSYKRKNSPREDKSEIQKKALSLRKELEKYFTPYTKASNPDLVSHVRSHKDADYLFVINDKRTFGKDWGVYGLVMEKGLPNTGTVRVRRSAGAVYDLVEHKSVPFTADPGSTKIPVSFPSSGGKLFLILPEKIGKLELNLGNTEGRGGKEISYNIRLNFVSGKPLRHYHPIRITVKNARGRVTDDSHSIALENGVYSGKLTIPLNGFKGKWSLTAEDLASGQKEERIFTVR